METVWSNFVNGYVVKIKVTDWQSFKIKYKKQLYHVAGYEEKFVDLVLSKVSGLEPIDVIPQYFISDEIGSRYIDFVIKSEDKGWNIAIELDGLGKMFDDNYVLDRDDRYRRFDDMLRRQNVIVSAGFTLLRFTNKTMLKDSKYIIGLIEATLKKKSNENSQSNVIIDNTVSIDTVNTMLAQHSIDRIVQLEYELEDKDKQLVELKQQLSNTDIYVNGFENITNQEELGRLQQKLDYATKQFHELKGIAAGYKSLLAIKELEHAKLQEICYQTIQQRFRMSDEDINKIIIKNTGNNWYSKLKTSIAQECLKRRWVNFWLVICMVSIIWLLSIRW